MCLSELQRGDWATVLGIQDRSLRMQLLRFGITAGSEVCVGARLPFGPIILQHGGIEFAMGRAAAREVTVRCHSEKEEGLRSAGTGS